MRTLYIADDGKIFEDKFECEKYEYGLATKNNTIIMLNEKRELLNSLNSMGQCFYIKVKTNKDVELLKNLYMHNEKEFDVPKSIGDFYYNNYTETWCLIDDRIKDLQDDLNDIKNELNNIKEIKKKLNEYSNQKK